MKNKILKTITTVAAVTFLLSASAIDSEFLAELLCVISLGWLGLFLYANRERLTTW